MIETRTLRTLATFLLFLLWHFKLIWKRNIDFSHNIFRSAKQGRERASSTHRIKFRLFYLFLPLHECTLSYVGIVACLRPRTRTLRVLPELSYEASGWWHEYNAIQSKSKNSEAFPDGIVKERWMGVASRKMERDVVSYSYHSNWTGVCMSTRTVSMAGNFFKVKLLKVGRVIVLKGYECYCSEYYLLL